MIGQKHITSWIDANISVLPHFLVFVGDKGSGKRTVSKYVADKLGATYSEIGIKVDDVREVIETASLSATKVLYCFADADNMRPEAKNAMLKITEEPPKNAYFVLTVQDDVSLLDTIKSRAQVFRMAPYSKQELAEYAKLQNYQLDMFEGACMTPGDADVLSTYNATEFLEYVRLVIDNIAEVEPANAFKSASRLAIKSDEGYDLALFWRVFNKLLADNLTADNSRYAVGIIITSEYVNKVQKLGVNKQQLYDSWVFDIRKAWV